MMKILLLQQLLLAFRNELIFCGPGSVVIPIDHPQAVSTCIGITEFQASERARHYAERLPDVSFFLVLFGA